MERVETDGGEKWRAIIGSMIRDRDPNGGRVMSRVDADAIEAKYKETLDLLMDTIRPTVQIAFNDMLLTGRGGIIFDGKGVRAVQPDEWEPTPTQNADGER